MNHFNRLKNQFIELYSMTRLQRSLRLLLRAFWLGIAGVILGWGINELFGVLPNPASWILMGLVFALVPVIVILISLYPVLFSLTPNKQWVWKMDQQLGLHEQLSTAWEVAEKGAGKESDQTGLVSDMLVQDMLVSMPYMREQMLKEGWYRKTDVFSSIVVLLLACILFAAMLFRPDPNIQTQNPPETAPQTILPQPGEEQADPEQQPGAGEQPGGESAEGAGEQPGEGAAENAQPGGEQAAPGDQAVPGEQAGENPSGGTTGNEAEGTDTEALADALRTMGSELSQQAGTYDLGKALENLDMESAAQELEELNQNLDELSPETRENMAQSMQDAAEDVEEAGELEMSQDMNEAAESLPEANEEANEALGNVAEDLRQMGGAMQSSSGANSGAGQGQSAETGNPEPLNRLSEEGGEFDLPQESGERSDLLSPAPPDAAGEGTASGTLDSTGQAGDDVIQNPILPNSLLWKWRNVVSEYFQR